MCLSPRRFWRFCRGVAADPDPDFGGRVVVPGLFAAGLGAGIARWGAVLVSSLLFALPHLLNPEVYGANLWIAFLPYLTTGLLLSLITLRDGTLELAMGVHAINNIIAFLFVAVPPYDIFPSIFVYHGELFTWYTVIEKP